MYKGEHCFGVSSYSWTTCIFNVSFSLEIWYRLFGALLFFFKRRSSESLIESALSEGLKVRRSEGLMVWRSEGLSSKRNLKRNSITLVLYPDLLSHRESHPWPGMDLGGGTPPSPPSDKILSKFFKMLSNFFEIFSNFFKWALPQKNPGSIPAYDMF